MHDWPSFVVPTLRFFEDHWSSQVPWGVSELGEGLQAREANASVESREWLTAWIDLLELYYSKNFVPESDREARLLDEAGDPALFCVYADVLMNREAAESQLVAIASERSRPMAVEVLINRLAYFQGCIDPIVLSFEFCRSLIAINAANLDLGALSMNQLHMALETRFHYLFPEEQKAIEGQLLARFGADGSEKVRSLDKQIEQRVSLHVKLGVRPIAG